MSARFSVLGTVLALVLVAPLTARAGDDLAKFAERNRILAQKVKLEVTDALAEARILEKNNADEAQAVLKRALAKVQNATVLPADEQTRLQQQLLGRIRALGEVIRQRQVGQKQKFDNVPLPKARPINPGPDNGPTGVADNFIKNAKGNLSIAEQRKRDAEKGHLAVVAGLEKSAMPTDADVTFPKNWKELSDRRKLYSGPRLTPKEVALLKALNSTLSVDFNGTTLQKAVEYLQERTGQTIIIDEGSFKDANVDYTTDTVTFKQKSLTFRTVLRKVLGDHNLTYVIKEGMIQVVTPERARNMMVVRVYPINDIVAAGPYAQNFGPYVARAQMFANAQGLINTIQATVEPSLWDVNGGGGTITFFPEGPALLIRAPAELHYQLGGGNLFGGSR